MLIHFLFYYDYFFHFFHFIFVSVFTSTSVVRLSFVIFSCLPYSITSLLHPLSLTHLHYSYLYLSRTPTHKLISPPASSFTSSLLLLLTFPPNSTSLLPLLTPSPPPPFPPPTHLSAQHPMNCLAFMKALNAHLRPEEKNKTVADNEKKNKMTPKKTTPGPAPGPVPGVRGTRTEGFQSMTSLSLTHAHMSRNTVLMLEVRTRVCITTCVV
jgi:hypothetical protein